MLRSISRRISIKQIPWAAHKETDSLPFEPLTRQRDPDGKSSFYCDVIAKLSLILFRHQFTIGESVYFARNLHRD